MPRNWQPREQKLLAEYLTKFYPKDIHMTRVRLGAIEPEAKYPDLTEREVAALGVWRRWADAVVITKRKMILIEAAIRPDTGEASKLEVYADLLPLTPELRPYLGLPLHLELVYAVYDAVVIHYCEKHGIRCVFFCPDWILDYLKELHPRMGEGLAPGGLLSPSEEEK